jgi:RNA polymerase sigma-70 factor (ECF subfamily)
LDHLKEAGRRNVRLDDVFEPQINEADTPGALVERNELRAGITRALAQLPSTLREAFVMHYVDDMPYETMSELLDVSVIALKMRTLRAREALKSALRQADVTGDRPVSSVCETP